MSASGKGTHRPSPSITRSNQAYLSKTEGGFKGLEGEEYDTGEAREDLEKERICIWPPELERFDWLLLVVDAAALVNTLGMDVGGTGVRDVLSGEGEGIWGAMKLTTAGFIGTRGEDASGSREGSCEEGSIEVQWEARTEREV
eukprot:CAMPEP_0184667572 /NCGR_PEP_ID=MMETSP0308-20130426/68265_1 /TAXON_ID=38269 /ORGANISM="Gloeochaete witrockiana, Strain SAG 46.84" /LENGTH=142 /DNA_ID=CAMNT_0027112865 /DNA_START=631 /DNA_END=1059 /DNA_ORIENTATION=-